LRDTSNSSNGNTESFKILSATETRWFGGVRGVRGKIYTIKIASTSSSMVNFTALVLNKERIPIEVLFQNNIYNITARITEGDALPNLGEPENNHKNSFNDDSKNSFLEYTTKDSNIPKTLTVKEFTQMVGYLIDGEALPN
jgi:hypothetical protein